MSEESMATAVESLETPPPESPVEAPPVEDEDDDELTLGNKLEIIRSKSRLFVEDVSSLVVLQASRLPIPFGKVYKMLKRRLASKPNLSIPSESVYRAMLSLYGGGGNKAEDKQ